MNQTYPSTPSDVESELYWRRILASERAAEERARAEIAAALARIREAPRSRWRISDDQRDLGEFITPTPEELASWAQEAADGVLVARRSRLPAFEAARHALARSGLPALERALGALRGRVPPGAIWDVWRYVIGVTRSSLGAAYRFRPGGRASGSRVGCCAAKAATMARALGRSLATVRRALTWLRDAGVLLVHRTGRGALRVPVAPPPATEIALSDRWWWWAERSIADRPSMISGDPVPLVTEVRDRIYARSSEPLEEPDSGSEPSTTPALAWGRAPPDTPRRSG